MSILFGMLKERGSQVTKSELLQMSRATSRFTTGPTKIHLAGRIGVGIQPYASHARSRMESGPRIDPCGNVLTLDGRLDNFVELAEIFEEDSAATADSEIVLAGFRRWGESCFSRLIGDWALALWSAADSALYLARDHAGTRTLYFAEDHGQLVWATHLDPFLSIGAVSQLSEDYVGCYLACRPVGELTPYERIRAVLPAETLVFRRGRKVRHSHWSAFDPASVRFKSDREYEEGFLHLFRQSVLRRTGAGAPILAQLSGGIDSTSIVCMSDSIRRSSGAESDLLDTISFYDDSENSLDERRYFSITEKQRGKSGIHVNAAFSQRTFEVPETAEGAYLLPGADTFALSQERRLHALMEEGDYRSVLSGIGGDEVLGGVPSPWPELAEYLVTGRLRKLVGQGIAWSMVDRTPLIQTLFGTVLYTFHLYRGAQNRAGAPPLWMTSELSERVREIDRSRMSSRGMFGVSPYRIDCGRSWQAVMETLPNQFPLLLSRPEYRFPFLDKDLVNFLFGLPPDQLRRPGRRRSLMRRALRGIVPMEILERRRKAFQLQAPLHALRNSCRRIEGLLGDSALARAGYVDRGQLQRAFESVTSGEVAGMQVLYRATALEIWLRSAPEAVRVLPEADRLPVPISLTA